MQQSVPIQAPVTEGFADLPGARLWYWDTGGDGLPIVLCHPASQSSDIWVHQQPVLATAGYRVIAYSRRGHGQSGRSQSVPGQAGSEVVAASGTFIGDLANLLDHLEVDRAHILGAAAGGITALAFAVAHPARTASLVLAGTIFSLSEVAWQQAFARLGIDRVRDHVPVEFLELGPSYRFSDPNGTALFHAYSELALSQAPVRQPSGIDVTFADLQSLSCPALLLTGEADLYAPPPLQAMVAAHLPNAITVTLPEVGHAPYWEQPAAFNRLILEFFANNSGAPAAN